MINKKLSLLYNLVLVGVLFMTMASSFSCYNSEYRMFTFNKGLKFSFEYPSNYKMDSINTYIKGKSAGGMMFLIKPTANTTRYGFIDITIKDTSEECANAKTAAEQVISNELTKDVLERSTTTIGGMQAELTVYAHETGVVPEAPPASIGIIRINRTVFFDYRGLIYIIEIESDEDKADQAKADFEHILQTFKIME